LDRINDEPFWQKQERRRERQLGQPCCTQSGISWTLIDMPGRFAVVIHGEYDCVNCFKHNAGRSSWQYFSTRLSEGQLTSGDTAGPLRRCLELIVQHDSPDAVIVLGTCPVEVIGDQFQTVVDAVSSETGVPMVALHTSGLKLSTQQDMLDWCFDTLVGIEPPTLKPEPNTVALIGMPNDAGGSAEIKSILDGTNLSLHGSFPQGASLSDWKKLANSDQLLVSDVAMFPRLMTRLGQSVGQITEVPLPYGLEQSMTVYRHLSALAAGPLNPHLDELQTQAQAAVDGFRERWAGTRMALGIRMHNSNQLNMVARGGLGHVRLFTELGLDVTLLIQGSPDPSMRPIWTELLAEHGVDLPFDVFAGPYAVGECIERGNYQIACVADWMHQQTNDTGVPTVFSHQMRAWLTGVTPNIRHIERVLERPQ
jgi:nitrogenase molybdenum-iron protein alpha/beta subunit